MTPLNVGMFVLIGAGACLLVGAVAVFVRKDAKTKHPAIMSFIGLLVVGVGTFGPSFMTQWGDLVLPLLGQNGQGPSDTDVNTFLTAAQQGKLKESELRAGLAILANNPDPRLEESLARAASAATTPTAKREIEATLRTVKATNERAAVIIRDFESGSRPLNTELLDPLTARAVERQIARRDPESVEITIDPATLERIKRIQENVRPGIRR